MSVADAPQGGTMSNHMNKAYELVMGYSVPLGLVERIADALAAKDARIAELQARIAVGEQQLASCIAERDELWTGYCAAQTRAADLQAQLATEQEDNDASNEHNHTQLVLHRAAIEAADADIKELQRHLAERSEWTPVPDGEYDMGLIDEPLYIFGNTDPEVCTHIEFADEEIMLDLGMTICRRVQREDDAQGKEGDK